MQFRIAFLKRDAAGTVQMDGFQVAENFSADYMPRVGEHVVLPDKLLEVIRAEVPALAIQRRFEVVSIDHHWNSFAPNNISIYLSTIWAAQPASLPSARREPGT